MLNVDAGGVPLDDSSIYTGFEYYMHRDWRGNVKSANDNGRKGGWIQTYTGRQFWPMDPCPEEVIIQDIAHSLSMMCRYAGHCERFYSVAEHSVLLARHVSPANKLAALLHDSSEAYLVDVPRPVKPFLAGYREAESLVMEAVCTRFGLPIEFPQEVHDADKAILTDEMRQNMKPAAVAWESEAEPLGVKLQYWSPEEAELEFMTEFKWLMREAMN